MWKTLAVVAVAGLAAVSARDAPQASSSDEFRLVVNVTDRGRDWAVPVHNTYVASIHVGAGLALVGNTDRVDSARVFYQNGTADERRAGAQTVVTDGGTPPFPSGLRLVRDAADATVSTARLDAGPGSRGVGLSAPPEPLVFLGPETWLACNQSIPYYRGKFFIVFKQAQLSSPAAVPPDGCLAVRLVPECAKLNVLPSGSYASHSFAIRDRCYGDVKAIDWRRHA